MIYFVLIQHIRTAANQNRFFRESGSPVWFFQLHENVHSSGISENFTTIQKCFIAIEKREKVLQPQYRCLSRIWILESSRVCVKYLTNLIHWCIAVIKFACWFDGNTRLCLAFTFETMVWNLYFAYTEITFFWSDYKLLIANNSISFSYNGKIMFICANFCLTVLSCCHRCLYFLGYIVF